MPFIRIAAPAKLNLHLHIGDKRPDGFHAIESLFLALDFGDTLCFETVQEPQKTEICMDWRLAGPPPELPPEQNIVFRAISLFRSRSGYAKGLTVTIEKHIPLGGGLGGGSSNAAAALLALNRLADPDGNGLFSSAILAEMGASLGSDVPFFLKNCSAAWVSGRGELVQPLTLPEPVRRLFFVLVNPGFPSPTAEAFKQLDEKRGTGDWGLGTRDSCLQSGYVGNLLNSHTNLPSPQSLVPSPLLASPKDWPFFNDFLPVFLANGGFSANYQHIISHLRELGADFAGLSGSGSTCFGVFTGRQNAVLAQQLFEKHGYFVVVCNVLR